MWMLLVLNVAGYLCRGRLYKKRWIIDEVYTKAFRRINRTGAEIRTGRDRIFYKPWDKTGYPAKYRFVPLYTGYKTPNPVFA